MKTNQDVAHHWMHGQAAKGSNYRTDGTTLWSYYTPIATKIDNIIYITSLSYSVSTSKHTTYARRAAGYANPNIFLTPAFDRWNTPCFTHEAMITASAEEATRKLETCLGSKRLKRTKIEAIQCYAQRREEITAHAARVGFNLPPMPEYTATDEEISNYTIRKAEQDRLKEELAKAAALKQQKIDAKDFKTWLKTGTGRFPNSFYERGNDYMTLKDGEIITSQQAHCPLGHAAKALRFWQSRKEGKGFTPYHTNGHTIHLGIYKLESIDEHGTVKAGCHTFTAKTIHAFIKLHGEALGL